MTDTSDAAHPGLGPATDVSADSAPDGSTAGTGQQDAPAPPTSDPDQYADDGLGAGDGVVPGGDGLTTTEQGADAQPGGAG
jgi:hypothetical protein